MPEVWTGNIVGKMHNNDVRYEDLAQEMGVTKAYVSMILNGRRKPAGIRDRMEKALENIVKNKRDS